MKNDFDASIFIITSDRQCIPPEEYDSLSDDGLFILVTNDTLNPEYEDDNSVCIYHDWKRLSYDVVGKRLQSAFKGNFDILGTHVVCRWQNNNVEIVKEKKTLVDNGFKATQKIIQNAFSLLQDNQTIENFIPVFMVAYHMEVSFDGRNIHGYIPSVRQMHHVTANTERINQALRTISKDSYAFPITDDGYIFDEWWTSMEWQEDAALIINKLKIQNASKTEKLRFLPLYKI